MKAINVTEALKRAAEMGLDELAVFVSAGRVQLVGKAGADPYVELECLSQAALPDCITQAQAQVENARDAHSDALDNAELAAEDAERYRREVARLTGVVASLQSSLSRKGHDLKEADRAASEAKGSLDAIAALLDRAYVPREVEAEGVGRARLTVFDRVSMVLAKVIALERERQARKADAGRIVGLDGRPVG